MDGIVAFGAGNQIGELSIGAVAGRDIITNNTIITPDAPPVIERAPPPPPPRSVRGFRDREAERAQLGAECQPRGGAWLTGNGGSGTTALLRQLVGTPTSQLRDGVALLQHTDLLVRTSSAEAQATFALDDVAQLLFDRFYRSNDPTKRIRIDIARAGHYLGPLQALIALDRLPLSQAQIERLADTLAGSALFVAAPGPPSDLLLHVPLHGLPRADARILLALAGGIDPDDPAAEPHLTTLCATLADQPLPLQLAGALIRSRAVNLPTLAARTVARSDATNALNHACRLSLEALGPAEHRLLSALVVGEPDLDTTALAAISELPVGELNPLLERLAALRLITLGGNRAAISTPSLRQELAHLLQPTAERKRAAAFFAAAVAKTIAPESFAREAQNLLNAAQTAHEFATPGQVGPLAQALHPHAVLSGQWSAWQALAELALTAAERENDTALRAWALHEKGTLAMFSGAPQAGITHLQAALALREAVADPTAALTQQNLTFAGGTAGIPGWMQNLWVVLGGMALFLFAGVSLFVTNQAMPISTPPAAALPATLAANLPPTLVATITPPTAPPAPSLTVAPPTAPPIAPAPTSPLSPATSTPTPTSTLSGFCRVIAPALNLRQGPGPLYPVVRALPGGTVVEPFAQAFDGAWLAVRVDQQQGWIARIGPEPLLECFSDFSDLPVGIIPVLPTTTIAPSITATAAFTETPTPTPSPLPTLEPSPTSASATPSATLTPTRRPGAPEPSPTVPPSPTLPPTATLVPTPTGTPSAIPEPTATPTPIIPG